MKHLLLIYCSLLFLVLSCKPEKPTDIAKDDFGDAKALILNEGNFMWGNASISLYDLSNNSIIAEDIYKNKNTTSVGDVLQSATIIDDKIYLVINNSSKIIIVDKKTLVKTGEITGLGSPRYIIDGLNGFLYSTDIYSDDINIINKATNTIHTTIPCIGWTEQLIRHNNKIYVCNKESNYVYIINSTTNTIVDSIHIGYGASNILLDNNDKLWVSSTGKSDLNIKANICRYNISGSSPIQENKWEITSGSANGLCCNKSKDKLYYIIGENIYTIASNTNALASSSLINKTGAIWYGLGIEPMSGDIFVADAHDYVQKSSIYRYSSDGTQLKASTKAGIISNGFLFWE
jgi:YVTN family beta-propeller protein